MDSGASVDLVSIITTILNLGWPGIVLVMLYIMWAEYRRTTREYIETLREVAGLKQQLRIKKGDTGELRPMISSTPEIERRAH